ncbi:MAG: HDOD domain-containing protein [Nitrospirota bacterium]|nr:HDOD domain-containing protein [Nitrospirota bacterium]MDH5587548.1 HDOD domain-containing protein [Nitrospirota bacterium]MDH5774589.1 HDOD domain-containing protein [Nitrospirota bacterium]
MTLSSTISTQQEESEAFRAHITIQLEKEDLALPLLPVVAHQVLQLSGDPNADVNKLSTLIQQDQALAGQILRIANSPAYLPRSPIVSLQQAVTWLGMNMLAGLAFSVSVQSGVFTIKGYEKEIRSLWAHALATGLYGKEIARRIRHNVENAFLCGLLHTIGKPIILHLISTSQSPHEGSPTWTILEPIIQEFHIPAGTKLAEAWKLPESVQEAIRLYPDDRYHQATLPTKGAIMTCLADHLASYSLGTSSLDEEALRALPVIHDLNFYPDDLDALLELREGIQQSVETFLV